MDRQLPSQISILSSLIGIGKYLLSLLAKIKNWYVSAAWTFCSNDVVEKWTIITVISLILLGNWLCCSRHRALPIDEMRALHTHLQAKKSMAVPTHLLQIFKFHYFSALSFKFPWLAFFMARFLLLKRQLREVFATVLPKMAIFCFFVLSQCMFVHQSLLLIRGRARKVKFSVLEIFSVALTSWHVSFHLKIKVTSTFIKIVAKKKLNENLYIYNFCYLFELIIYAGGSTIKQM